MSDTMKSNVRYIALMPAGLAVDVQPGAPQALLENCRWRWYFEKFATSLSRLMERSSPRCSLPILRADSRSPVAGLKWP